MCAAYNRVVLLGNLTRDPEIKHTQGGTVICNLSLAVNERVKRGNDWVDEAVFVDIVAFGRTAEVAGEYLVKGSQALFEGRLKLDSWTDKNTGQKRTKLHVVCDRLQMLGAKQGGGGTAKPQSEYSEPERPRSNDVPPPMQQDDDIPF